MLAAALQTEVVVDDIARYAGEVDEDGHPSDGAQRVPRRTRGADLHRGGGGEGAARERQACRSP
jgi:hypothetical protein